MSLERSTLQPSSVTVIDNGRDANKVEFAMYGIQLKVDIFTPSTPFGVAESWNWFIKHLPEERIITNDDISFFPDSVEAMCATPGDLVFGHGYSCFLIRDSAVQKIGMFDENISPGYAYWEDIDYDMRIRLAVVNGVNFVQENAPCMVAHGGSKTNDVASPKEIEAHHRKFTIARQNFVSKWAHLPPEMQHPAVKG